ncbi:unnamed protein product, partial [Bubo scandiacus]
VSMVVWLSMTDVSSNSCQMSRKEELGEKGAALSQHRGSKQRVLSWGWGSRCCPKLLLVTYCHRSFAVGFVFCSLMCR